MLRVDGLSFAGGRDALWFCATAIGLALCLTLTGTFDTILASHVAIASFDYRILGTPVSGNAPVVVACAAAAVVAWTMRGMRRLGWGHVILLAALQVASCAALFVASDDQGPIAVVLWWVLASCSAVQLVLWAQVLAGIGRVRALALFACALLLDSLFNMADGLFASRGAAVFCTSAALVSPCVLGAFCHAIRLSNGPFHEGSDENDATPVATTPLVLSMVCLACYGVAVGAVQSSDVISRSAESTSQLVQVATALLSCMLLVFAVCFEYLRNPDALMRVLVLSALIVAVYYASLHDPDAGAGIVMTSVVRTVVFSYVWVLACEALPHPTRAAFVFATGWGIFTLAHTLSTKLGVALMGAGESVAYGALVAGSLVCLVVANAYPQLAGRGNLRNRAGSSLEGAGAAGAPAAGADDLGASLAGAQPQIGPDVYERGCARLAKKYGLTAREAEVLLPLVRGRPNSSIAAMLTVGTETVRTHIRHIYQKTEIHSREKLMDTVEELGSMK